jgi:DNA-binding response OmpR family regulator
MAKRVLIVEDDTNLSHLMKEQLDSAGFTANVAANGEAGMRAVESKPDLILLDIMLPKMNGLELMKYIREKDDWGKKVPIIIISNLTPDTADIIDSVATYEPVYYLVKADFALTELSEKVQDILGPASK